MGVHQGWRVYESRLAAVGQVWVPARKAYRSRSFRAGDRAERMRAARRWCADEAARERLGRAAVVAHGSATVVLTRDYLADMAGLGRSASHQRDVRLVLGRLAEQVRDLADDSAAAQISEWLAAVGAQVTARTRNKYLVIVRGLVRWGVRHGRLASDPTQVIRMAKQPDFLRPQFSIDELRQMARAIGDPYHVRFAVAFYLGLRSAEVARIRWDQLDRGGRVWAVTGKGNKQRLAWVPDELLTLLDVGGTARSGPVFGERIARQSATISWWDLQYFMRRLGLPAAGRSPHSLRHSYAGVMTATGMPSALLRAYLGHSSEQTTAGYTKLATRYVAAVGDWRRGQIELLTGWSERWPAIERTTTAE